MGHREAQHSEPRQGQVGQAALDRVRWCARARGRRQHPNGVYSAGSVTHTVETANQAWWQVDLGASTDIGEVWLYNRTETPYNLRLSDFWIMTSDSEFTSGDLTASRTGPGVTAVRIAGPAGDLRTVKLNGRGRYVRIQLEADNTPLSLAEVEVYAG
ncbi:galactose-binding domain-containing protein [Streptomyces sp. NPDC001275]